MKHALLSASGASRWMACTPSARLGEHLPDSVNQYAEEGTLAHELAEALNSYAFKRITKAQLNTKLKTIKENAHYNLDMQNYIVGFCHYVHESYNEARAISKDAVIALEERLDFSQYVPEGFGTGDVIIVADGVLKVIDLKYGIKNRISAERNEQMMLYALGALDKYGLFYGIEYVNMAIYQPRLDSISQWGISTEELKHWALTELKEKASLAYDGAGEFRPGKHCRYCKVNATCRALAEENLKLAAYEFKPALLLSNEEIADILKISERLTNWANDVSAYALDQAINHNVIYAGWKVVEGRSKREITDPDTVGNILLSDNYNREDIYKEKLRGIGELEKLMGKEQFQEKLGAYVVKPQGKPTLAPETDKRPVWNSAGAAAAEFAEVVI